MNILYLSPNPHLSDNNRRTLSSLGNITLLPVKKTKTSDLPKHLKQANIILLSPSVYSIVAPYLRTPLPQLSHITLLSSGRDWFDTQIPNVSVGDCSGANARSVAEHTWGLILGLSKHITRSDRDIRSGAVSSYEGTELHGKTLGILGTGAIGSLVGAMGAALGMRVLGFNRSGSLPQSFESIVPIRTLFHESDVISIHMPLTRETEHFVTAELLSLCKPHAIIVNTAREAIVNKQAILQAFNAGNIAGYGLDLQTTVRKNDPYLRCDTVILTPHSAYNTKEAKQRMEDMAVKEINAYIQRMRRQEST